MSSLFEKELDELETLLNTLTSHALSPDQEDARQKALKIVKNMRYTQAGKKRSRLFMTLLSLLFSIFGKEIIMKMLGIDLDEFLDLFDEQ